MAEINILIIEDLETEILSFNNSAIRLGETNGVELKLKNYKNLSNELYKDILENEYDFVIVDLKLENGELGGNIFLKIIKENLHIPIIINSANLSDLEAGFNIPNNPLIRQFNPSDNTENTDEILSYIIKIYKTGLTKVLGKNGAINNTLNNLIWCGGLNNFEKWLEFNDEEKSNKSLSRYILSHLHHNLSGDYEDFHSEEIYLKIIGDKKFDTGAILKDNLSGDFFIILTPACDIANGRTDYYLVARINDINIDIEKLKEHIDVINNQSSHKSAVDKAYRKIDSFIKNMKSDDSKKDKFLPKSTIFKGGYINFEKLEKINNSEKINYEIVCYISSHFLKDIVSDFGYYYSRQGQPNLNKDIIVKNLLS